MEKVLTSKKVNETNLKLILLFSYIIPFSRHEINVILEAPVHGGNPPDFSQPPPAKSENKEESSQQEQKQQQLQQEP